MHMHLCLSGRQPASLDVRVSAEYLVLESGSPTVKISLAHSDLLAGLWELGGPPSPPSSLAFRSIIYFHSTKY